MADLTTRRMIRLYTDSDRVANPIMFLAGFFQTPQENFFPTEEVEVDVQRMGEQVAIVLHDITTGYRYNKADLFQNRAFKPPVFKEAVHVNSFDLLKRMPGQEPFRTPEFRANVIQRLYSSIRPVEAKIRRAIELQAAQVLTTGKVDLKDENGLTLYELDYGARATHFPTAGTLWDQSGATPIQDIDSLAEVIRADGYAVPDQVIMDTASFNALIANEQVQKLLDVRRYELGRIATTDIVGNGGTYRGVLNIGSYTYDLWTYNGRYEDPQTGNSTAYLGRGKVIVRASDGRMDGLFGAIPNIGNLLGVQTTRLLPELPRRINANSRGMDLHLNAWLTPDGENFFGGVGARPLMVPTAIDTYGCLTTLA